MQEPFIALLEFIRDGLLIVGVRARIIDLLRGVGPDERLIEVVGIPLVVLGEFEARRQVRRREHDVLVACDP